MVQFLSITTYNLMRYAVIIAVFLGIAVNSAAQVSACTVCHSKNPKMVRMHEAQEFKNCFMCHGKASTRKKPKARDESVTDPLCILCHGTGKNAESMKHKAP